MRNGRYTDSEPRGMLRAERTALIRRVITLKHEVRERVAELEEAERRLAQIDDSEACLNGSAP